MNLGRVGGDGNEIVTQMFKKAPVGRSSDGFAANTELFIHVWDVISKDGTWEKHDWTVKADPDAFVIAWRIRTHLKSHTGQTTYVPNCNAFPSDYRFPMMYGSFEALSKSALNIYFNKDGAKRCSTELPWTLWGEDS